MDDADADAPVVTPYSGSMMDAPASPSLQQQPSPSSPPQAQPGTSTSIAPDNSTGTDPTKLSTAERIKLSVAALITGRDSSSSVTPAPDHFTVLPGDSPQSRGENLSARQNPEQHSSSSRLEQQHAIRHGLSSSSDNNNKQWGMEGLLRSKTGSRTGTAGGAAVDAKRKLSAHLGMSAVKPGGEGGEQQQSCEYVAMNTPCESPVAGGRVDNEDQQWGAREEVRRNSTTSTHSSSSRTGLVTRLGSALQSWTSVGGSKSWGSSSSAAACEGRPGPLGARYTQQAPESYSPFEPSPHHQLQKRLPVQPAFTAAAAAGRRGGEVQEEPPDEEIRASVSDGRTVSMTTADKLRPTDGDRPESRETQPGALEEQGQEGREMPPIDGNSHGTPTPNLRHGSPSDARNAGPELEGGLGADVSPVTGGTAAVGGSSPNDVVNVAGNNGDRPVRKVGLWELKAERSRLENALVEAESDRDVEKARAWEAANRLEAAVARLEGVLVQGGDGGGVSVGGADDSVGRVG